MIAEPVRAIHVSVDFGQGPSPVGRLTSRERNIYFEAASGHRSSSPIGLTS